MNQAVIDMIVDERALGAGDRVLHRLKLLRDIDARPLLFDHPDDAFQVPGRTVEPLDDRGMIGMIVMGHVTL